MSASSRLYSSSMLCLMFSAICSEEMKNVGVTCITGSPLSSETCSVILRTTSPVVSATGVAVAEGACVGSGVGVAVGEGSGTAVAVAVGSGVEALGECPMQAVASSSKPTVATSMTIVPA